MLLQHCHIEDERCITTLPHLWYNIVATLAHLWYNIVATLAQCWKIISFYDITTMLVQH